MTTAVATAALIPAAGQGIRLGHGPKSLLKLGGRTLLDILLNTLAPLVDDVAVAAPQHRLQQMQTIAGSRARVIAGGTTRQESVGRLLKASDAEILLIQDVASPYFLNTAVYAPEQGAGTLRPLFCRSMRPASGLSTDIMLDINARVLGGGFDIIKDDELTYDDARSPLRGASDAVLATIQRAASADLVVTPGPFATAWEDQAASRAFLQACRGGPGGHRAVMPIIQGGKHAGGLPQYIETAGGTDFMIIFATWLDHHPGAMEQGARAFRDAWEQLAVRDAG